MFLNLFMKKWLVQSQIQPYQAENNKIPNTIRISGEVDTTGPSNGNCNPYKTKKIPDASVKHVITPAVKRVFVIKKQKPMARPSSPVVKGKISNSLG